MNHFLLENYLKQIETFTVSQQEPSLVKKYVLNLINDYENDSENGNYKDFFLGEKAFYSDQYEQALKFYLQARNVPDFHFFCYRASAFVSDSLNHKDKTLKFLKKAGMYFPQDFFLNYLNQKYSQEMNENKLEQSEILEKPLDVLNEATEEPLHENELYQTEQLYTNDIMAIKETTPKDNQSNTLEQLLSEKMDFSQQINEPFLNTESVNTSSTTRLDQSHDDFENIFSDFNNFKKNTIFKYLQNTNKTTLKENCLFFFHRWEREDYSSFILLDSQRKSQGGIFFRWENKGYVINPGKGFLKQFHAQGFTLKDIDYVFITNDQSELSEDVKNIYYLNKQLNNKNDQLQVIHYYLNTKCYQELSSIIKAQFKQEGHITHPLDMYFDSPDVETIEINEKVSLNYFPIGRNETYLYGKGKDNSSLGITFELKRKDQSVLKMAYVSGATWSPLLSHYIGSVDILICGIGETCLEDIKMVKHQQNSLGLYGAYNLIEELQPKVALCTEFDGSKGDLRLEMIQLLRKNYLNAYQNFTKKTSIIPAENAFCINLQSLQFLCSVNNSLASIENLRVTKKEKHFGELCYMQNSTCL